MAVWHTDLFFKRYGHLDDQTAAASHIRYEMHPITHLIAVSNQVTTRFPDEPRADSSGPLSQG